MGFLRERAKPLMDAWVLKRQGKDFDPVLFEPRRQYILPTRQGWWYATMVVVMLIGSLNYSNNLALGFSFLLASIGFISMFHTHATLSGLGLKLEKADSVFAGDPLQFKLVLFNRSAKRRAPIEFSFDREVVEIADVPARGEVTAQLRVPTTKRGWITLTRFETATCYPLGLFRTWVVVHPYYQGLVWPKPAGNLKQHLGSGTTEHSDSLSSTKEGGDEFFGLRPYHPGDPVSRIAWKTLARQQGLFVKQYGETTFPSQIYDYTQVLELGHEERLSQLAQWLLESKHRGELFGLKTPWGDALPPEGGPAQLERCLNLLAVAP